MLPNGTSRSGQVLEVMGSKAIVQVSPGGGHRDRGHTRAAWPGALSPSSGGCRSRLPQAVGPAFGDGRGLGTSGVLGQAGRSWCCDTGGDKAVPALARSAPSRYHVPNGTVCATAAGWGVTWARPSAGSLSCCPHPPLAPAAHPGPPHVPSWVTPQPPRDPSFSLGCPPALSQDPSAVPPWPPAGTGGSRGARPPQTGAAKWGFTGSTGAVWGRPGPSCLISPGPL